MTLPALLKVLPAARLAGMKPRVFRRWLEDARAQRKPDGTPLYPGLVQTIGRVWLVQVKAMCEAMGVERVDIERLALETSQRVDVLEVRVSRLEARRAG